MPVRLLIVGLRSEVSDDPRLALEPYTPNGTGERLWKMVNDVTKVSKDRYFMGIDFINVEQAPSLEEVKEMAATRSTIVLGRSAWRALGFPRGAEFYSRHGSAHLVPHPSGRTRNYNSRRHRLRTGRLVARLACL